MSSCVLLVKRRKRWRRSCPCWRVLFPLLSWLCPTFRVLTPHCNKSWTLPSPRTKQKWPKQPGRSRSMQKRSANRISSCKRKARLKKNWELKSWSMPNPIKHLSRSWRPIWTPKSASWTNKTKSKWTKLLAWKHPKLVWNPKGKELRTN